MIVPLESSIKPMLNLIVPHENTLSFLWVTGLPSAANYFLNANKHTIEYYRYYQ